MEYEGSNNLPSTYLVHEWKRLEERASLLSVADSDPLIPSLKLTTLMMLNYYRTSERGLYIHDIAGYIDSLKSSIEEYKKHKKLVAVDRISTQYANLIQTKVDESTKLVQTLQLDVNTQMDELDKHIHALTKEIEGLAQKEIDSIKELDELESKLKNAQLVKIIFTPLKIAAGCLAVAGPKGMVASAILGTTLNLVEGSVIGDTDISSLMSRVQPINSAPRLFDQRDKLMDHIYNSEKGILLTQVTNLTDELDKMYAPKPIEDPKVKEMRDQLFKGIKDRAPDHSDAEQIMIDKAEERKAAVHLNKMEDLENKCAQVKDLTKKQEHILESRRKAEKIAETERKVAAAAFAVNVTIQEGAQLAQFIKQSNDELAKVKAAKQLRLQNIKNLNQAAHQAEHDGGKAVNDLEKTCENIVANLGHASKNKGSTIQYYVGGMFADMKDQWKAFVENLHLSGDLLKTMTTIQRTIDQIFAIHKSIQEYEEHRQFASCMSNLHIAGEGSGDQRIDTMRRLSINSLLRLEHKRILSAYHQHTFPFSWTPELSIQPLISEWNVTPEQLTESILGQINQIKNALNKHTTSFLKSHELITSLPQEQIVYTWRYGQFPGAFDTLTRGEDTVFEIPHTTALMRRYPALKITNVQFQLEGLGLDRIDPEKKLMVHVNKIGNAKFHIGDACYSLDVPNPPTISYAFSNKNRGNQVWETYLKELTGKYIGFSPYGNWIVSMNLSGCDKSVPNPLSKLSPSEVQKLSLKLVVDGQYINTDKMNNEMATNIASSFNPYRVTYHEADFAIVDEAETPIEKALAKCRGDNNNFCVSIIETLKQIQYLFIDLGTGSALLDEILTINERSQSGAVRAEELKNLIHVLKAPIVIMSKLDNEWMITEFGLTDTTVSLEEYKKSYIKPLSGIPNDKDTIVLKEINGKYFTHTHYVNDFTPQGEE